MPRAAALRPLPGDASAMISASAVRVMALACLVLIILASIETYNTAFSGLSDADAVRQGAELKRRWLTATGQRSPVLDHDARTLRHLVDYLRSCSGLQVFRLECDGALVAGLVSVVQERQVAAFVSAFDPRLTALRRAPWRSSSS